MNHYFIIIDENATPVIPPQLRIFDNPSVFTSREEAERAFDSLPHGTAKRCRVIEVMEVPEIKA